MLSCCSNKFGGAKPPQISKWAHATKLTSRIVGSACCALLQGTYEKLKSEVPKYKMITPSVLSDRLRVSLHVCCLLICQAVQGAASSLSELQVRLSGVIA